MSEYVKLTQIIPGCTRFGAGPPLTTPERREAIHLPIGSFAFATFGDRSAALFRGTWIIVAETEAEIKRLVGIRDRPAQGGCALSVSPLSKDRMRQAIDIYYNWEADLFPFEWTPSAHEGDVIDLIERLIACCMEEGCAKLC